MRGLVAAGLGVVALFGACSSDDDIQSTTSGQPGAGTGMFVPPECGELGESFTDETCGECARAECCDALVDCDENTACTDLIECRATCADVDCVAQCHGALADGVDDLEALDACLQGPCASACPISTGICGTPLTFGDQECDDCLGASCCGELEACLAQSACDDCMTSAAGVDCDMNALYVAATDCFTTSCSNVCER
jgi:hypothetical protein